MGWVVNATFRPLYPRERPVTHCIGDWVGLEAGLDRCGIRNKYNSEYARDLQREAQKWSL